MRRPITVIERTVNPSMEVRFLPPQPKFMGSAYHGCRERMRGPQGRGPHPKFVGE